MITDHKSISEDGKPRSKWYTLHFQMEQGGVWNDAAIYTF